MPLDRSKHLDPAWLPSDDPRLLVLEDARRARYAMLSQLRIDCSLGMYTPSLWLVTNPDQDTQRRLADLLASLPTADAADRPSDRRRIYEGVLLHDPDRVVMPLQLDDVPDVAPDTSDVYGYPTSWMQPARARVRVFDTWVVGDAADGTPWLRRDPGRRLEKLLYDLVLADPFNDDRREKLGWGAAMTATARARRRHRRDGSGLPLY